MPVKKSTKSKKTAAKKAAPKKKSVKMTSKVAKNPKASKTSKTSPKHQIANKKYYYFFGSGKADGSADMKDLLGGKGANLAEMTNAGVKVPPGFTLTTEVCTLYYENNMEIPKVIDELKKKYPKTAPAFFRRAAEEGGEG